MCAYKRGHKAKPSTWFSCLCLVRHHRRHPPPHPLPPLSAAAAHLGGRSSGGQVPLDPRSHSIKWLTVRTSSPLSATMELAWSRLVLQGMMHPGPSSQVSLGAPATLV
ncbi:hypothetical protein VPH35_089130 [Triticum aestivum]